MDTNEGFRIRLIELKQRTGLTESQIATAAGVTRGLVNHYVRGRRVEPRRSTARKLAAALGTSVSWLLDGLGSPPAKRALDAAAARARDVHAHNIRRAHDEEGDARGGV